MTLEEAIEKLDGIFELGHEDWGNPEYDALKLGIEALKLIKRNRRYTPQPYNIKLPGETQEPT